MPSTREIANYVGVSTSTVSLALNNKEGVSKAMRQRILQAASELTAQEANNGGPAKRAEHISVLVLHSTLITATDYFKELLMGIEGAAHEHQLHLRLSADDPGHMSEHITNLYLSEPDLRPDGIIYLGSREIESTLKKATDSGLPLVQIGIPYYPGETNFVAPDEVQAGYMAAKHLLELGHRRLALVGHQQTAPHLKKRMEGYHRALAEYGIAPEADFLRPYEGEGYAVEVAAIQQATRDFLEHGAGISAILLTNWQSSAIALPMLREAGYRIPDDLSVIVFDDFEHARTYSPPLTAIAYPLVHMGTAATRMLFEHIHSAHLQRSEQIFRPRLMIRESTRRIG